MASDYESIVNHCLKVVQLWEDPEFPAVQSSVFYHQTPPFTFQWKRPQDIFPNPIFVSDSSDISSGKLGDRWFAACLGCLQTAEGLLYRVVPADQGFEEKHDYVGIFRFRIWWCGEWTEVLIDDRLPVVNNRLVFVQSQGASVFWPALLEKAYAKLHGSYEALKYGTSLDGLSDLTGGIAESIPLKQESTGCTVVLANLLKMTTIVLCKVSKESSGDNKESSAAANASQLANGIVVGDSYRIYSMNRVETLNGDKVQLLRLKSTTGSGASHYMGDWSPGSVLWQSLDVLTRQRLVAYLDSTGEFWMTYTDWLKTFTVLEAVHLDADTARDEPSLIGKSTWMLRLYHGRWQRGVSAGGCRNNADTFHMNPQLSIHLPENDEVVMALNQHTATDPKVIGFTGYPHSHHNSAQDNDDASSTVTSIGKSYFKSRKSLLNSQYTNSRQVSLRVKLEAGNLIVLPTTFEPGEEATFTFRVFARHPVRIRIIDVIPSVTGSVFARARQPHASPVLQNGGTNTSSSSTSSSKVTKDFSQYEPLFNQAADERRTVNAFELQDLLETCLPNDYIKSCASLEVCRQVIVAFDTSGMGRITFPNFKDLMCSLKGWHGVFKNHTKEKSGILKADRLRDALAEVGFQLSSAILSVLMMRYIRKDGTLRFGDFVAIILNLSIGFDAFEKRDPMQHGTIRVNRAEWLRLALSC